MDFFGGIGNFFNGLFGGNKKKEEDERRQAPVQTLSRPTLNRPSNGLAGPTIQMPQAFQMPNQQQPSLLQDRQQTSPWGQNASSSLGFQPQAGDDDLIKNKISGYYVMSPAAQQQALVKARGDQQREQSTKRAETLTEQLNKNPFILNSRKDEINRQYTPSERAQASAMSRKQRMDTIGGNSIWGDFDKQLEQGGRDGQYRFQVGKDIGNTIFKTKGEGNLSDLNFNSFIQNYNNLSGDEQADIREGLQKLSLRYNKDGDAASSQFTNMLATVLNKDYGLVDEKGTSFLRNVGRTISGGGFVGDAAEGIRGALDPYYNESYSKQVRDIEQGNTGGFGGVNKFMGAIPSGLVDATAGNVVRTFGADGERDQASAESYVKAYQDGQISLQELRSAINALPSNNNLNAGFTYDEGTGQLRRRNALEGTANFAGKVFDAGTTVSPFTFGRAAPAVGAASRGTAAASAMQRLTPGQAMLAGDAVSSVGNLTGQALQGREITPGDVGLTVAGTLLGNVAGLAGRNRSRIDLAGETPRTAGTRIDPEGIAEASRRTGAPSELEVPTAPNNSITQAPQRERTPAITSANPNYRPPQVPEQPPVRPQNMPERVGPEQPTFQEAVEAPIAPQQPITPDIETPNPVRPQTADEAAAAAQRAIDDAATRPTPDAPEVATAPIEAPSTAQARAIAEQSTAINPDAVAAQTARQAANNAPTEAIADMPTNARESGDFPDELAGSPSRPDQSEATLTDKDFAKRVFSNVEAHKDVKARLARSVGMTEDIDGDLRKVLADGGVKKGLAEKIASKYDQLEEVVKEHNKIMRKNRRVFGKDGIDGLNEADAKAANKLIDRYGRMERDLNGYIRRLEGQRSIGQRVANAVGNITGARNASLLSSVGGIERNLTQEIGATLLDGISNPIRTSRAMLEGGGVISEVIRAYKRSGKEWAVAPKTVSETFPYLVGNIYRTLMSPVTGIGNVRKTITREALAESLLVMQGRNPSRAEIKKFAGSMGADSEVVANNLMGILNGMTSRGKGLEVMDAYKEFVRTGSPAAKKQFMESSERAANLATKLSQIAAKSNDPKARLGASLMNTVFPFVNTATNLMKLTGSYTLNPKAMSIPDEILKSVRSNPQNIANILKSRGTQYGMLTGAYALYSQDVIGYNDGDDIDKPRGVYIKTGEDTYFPLRGTPVELPIAAVVAAGELSKDIANGNAKSATHYAGIVTGSLPYVDSTNNLVAATGSAVDEYLKGGDTSAGTGDGGYAAKSYIVNLAKSYVPFSNNGVVPALEIMKGNSVNAKSTYDKDMGKWLGQSIRQAYDPKFRDSLKDSRDAAGRVRTVDQQAGFTIRKQINDASTAEFNDAISNLVKYGKDNGLGTGTQDMFNTFANGKTHNFTGVRNAITFLDAVDGKPDNTKKLEKNGKLADLNKQIYDGFFGDNGNELLKLDGKELRSDAQITNKQGTKNSGLPISMAAIKNAIAQNDLAQEDWDKLNEISETKNGLYNRRKAGEFNYDQEQVMRAELAKQEAKILQGSEGYKKLEGLMTKLESEGFFEKDGFGSTRSGQTFLWNSLNALLGDKAKTPAADWQNDSSSKSGYGYGRGGRGGRGKRGIVSAQLPESLIGAKTTGKYAKAAPLFKPIADLQAPKGDGVPKGRTISVKRGVHL